MFFLPHYYYFLCLAFRCAAILLKMADKQKNKKPETFASGCACGIKFITTGLQRFKCPTFRIYTLIAEPLHSAEEKPDASTSDVSSKTNKVWTEFNSEKKETVLMFGRSKKTFQNSRR